MPILTLRVVAVADNPNADRLKVYQLEGAGNGLVQIVANDSNVYRVGDVVMAALVGTVLADGTEIKKGKFRGVRSFGMLLGKTDAEVGSDLTQSLGARNIEKNIDDASGVISEDAWLRYTSIDGYLKLRKDILAAEEVIVTEKSHGSNFRAGFRGDAYLVGTHTSKILPSRMEASSWPEGHLIGKALRWCEEHALEGRIRAWREAHPEADQMAIYGEVMGFKCSDLHYGEKGALVRLFGEVQINGVFLDYDDALGVIAELFPDHSLENLLVPMLYRGKPDAALLKELRDKPSTLAAANGVEQISEGIVIRANPETFSEISGDRLIAKWKGPLYSERKSLRSMDPEELPRYLTAHDLIFDFVTAERIRHVWSRAQASGLELSMRNINEVVEMLLDDILKESEGEWPDGTSIIDFDFDVLLRWTRNISNDLIAMVMQDIAIGMYR